MLGVLSSTGLLTGTWDWASSLPELAHEAGEFFREACFSLGKAPGPVSWGGRGRERKEQKELERSLNNCFFYVYAYK